MHHSGAIAPRGGGGVFSPSPRLRGEGWGEGLYPQMNSWRIPLTRIALQFDLSPQAGRGEKRSLLAV